MKELLLINLRYELQSNTYTYFYFGTLLYLLFIRYLVAAKNIMPGEILIREEPIAVGPMIYRTDRLCFACLRSLPKIVGGKQYTCSRCNVASLCSVACEVRN